MRAYKPAIRIMARDDEGLEADFLVWDIPTVKATTTDDRRRIVMPETCPPRATVTIQDLDKNTWLVRRVVPERSVKMIPIPVIKKLPDDPEWEKTEAALARYASGKLPPPEP